EPALQADRHLRQPRQRRGVLRERPRQEDLRISEARCVRQVQAGLGESSGALRLSSLRAKRSNPESFRGTGLDCFVASLLGMTTWMQHHAFLTTDTKNPSVPVRRGVISQPSSVRSAASAKASALSHSTLAVSSGDTTENSGWRATKARTCSEFS